MKLTCDLHQLCFNCATETYHEKVWIAGGLDINPRIECDNCNKTTMIKEMLLKECKCIVDCEKLRELHKNPFEYEKKCKVYGVIISCKMGRMS